MRLLSGVLLVFISFLMMSCGGSDSTPDTFARANSYEECVHSGGAIQEVFPPICTLPDGSQFQASLSFEEEGPCEDLCGDGVCQEYTCLAIGCPCSETVAQCPVDCTE